jgi:hypothetical protein
MRKKRRIKVMSVILFSVLNEEGRAEDRQLFEFLRVVYRGAESTFIKSTKICFFFFFVSVSDKKASSYNTVPFPSQHVLLTVGG